MIDAFAKEGFDVFSGNEKPLIENVKSGGAGCISATANINPGKIAETYRNWQSPEGEKLQAWINEIRGVMQGYVMIPALKYVIAHYGGDALWQPVRPPLVETPDAEGRDMVARLDKLGFSMPGLRQAMAVAAE
jgi:4-hydroxy-tetrahydrodipicolinate synthase